MTIRVGNQRCLKPRRIRVEPSPTWSFAAPMAEQIASKVLSSGVARFVLASVDGSSVTLADTRSATGRLERVPTPQPRGMRRSASWIDRRWSHACTWSGQSGLRSGAVVDLSNGEPAPVLGVRLATGTPMTQPLPDVALRLGTTRGTNALLEGRIDPVLLVVTKGFPRPAAIGNQHRPDIFAHAGRASGDRACRGP